MIEIGIDQRFPKEKQSLYFPTKYGARLLDVGSNWNSINVGIRVRQSRVGSWPVDVMTLNAVKVGFGLCAGTSAPYGSLTPANFIGMITGANWTRVALANWWNTGWQLIHAIASGVTVRQSGTRATLRVSQAGDGFCSAWYCRFTRTGSGNNIRTQLFLPVGTDSPTEDDFNAQMARDEWSSHVNNHASYQEVNLVTSVDEGLLGELDSVNIISTVDNWVTSNLRAVKIVSARALVLA